MANINKIRLSGQTYDIQDLNAPKSVELTQAQYNALVSGGTVDPNTFYIITDATGGDLSNYYTKSETNTLLGSKADTATTYNMYEVNFLLANKQATLVSGTNIKTINNESILGSGNIDIQGGGSTYTAGRGIDITNDTISVSLPISAGTGTNALVYNSTTNVASGNYSHAEGYNTTASGYYDSHAEGGSTTASGNYSHAEGYNTTASGNFSHAEGVAVTANNLAEHASGRYNNSVSASTTWGNSGNTLFSVGNGTADNARHNAFEIRQNGDIYLSSGGTDIKLQDHLGGGGGSITIDPSLDSGSSNAVANSAITNALHETYFYNISKESDSNPQTKFILLWKYIDTKQTTYFNPSFVIAGINGIKIASLNGNPDRTNFELIETSAITTSISSSSTDTQVPSAKAVNDKLGGLSLVKLTQAEYDALSPNYDSNTLYIVTVS